MVPKINEDPPLTNTFYRQTSWVIILRNNYSGIWFKSIFDLRILTSNAHINRRHCLKQSQILLFNVQFAVIRNLSSDEIFHQIDDSLGRICANVYNRDPKNTGIGVLLFVQF